MASSNNQISLKQLELWLLMEYAGILRGRKRRLFIEELKRKAADPAQKLSEAEEIILTAQKKGWGDRQLRIKNMRKMLKSWERAIARQTNPTAPTASN